MCTYLCNDVCVSLSLSPADDDDFTLTVTDSSADQSVGQELSLYCTFTSPNGTLGQLVCGTGTIKYGSIIILKVRSR